MKTYTTLLLFVALTLTGCVYEDDYMGYNNGYNRSYNGCNGGQTYYNAHKTYSAVAATYPAVRQYNCNTVRYYNSYTGFYETTPQPYRVIVPKPWNDPYVYEQQHTQYRHKHHCN
jgi:hypothetical protein